MEQVNAFHKSVGQTGGIHHRQQHDQQHPATKITGLQAQTQEALQVAEGHIAVPTAALQMLFDKVGHRASC